MPRRQKIWITRAQPGADVTADRVRALGHDALVAPLLAVRPVEDVAIDLSGVAALAFTSANGVRTFADRSGERSLKESGRWQETGDNGGAPVAGTAAPSGGTR